MAKKENQKKKNKSTEQSSEISAPRKDNKWYMEIIKKSKDPQSKQNLNPDEIDFLNKHKARNNKRSQEISSIRKKIKNEGMGSLNKKELDLFNSSRSTYQNSNKKLKQIREKYLKGEEITEEKEKKYIDKYCSNHPVFAKKFGTLKNPNSEIIINSESSQSFQSKSGSEKQNQESEKSESYLYLEEYCNLPKDRSHSDQDDPDPGFFNLKQTNNQAIKVNPYERFYK